MDSNKPIFRIGMSLEAIDREIVANVEAAVAAAARNETFEARRTIGFENWTTFFRSMTPSRIAILEHVAAYDVASTLALSSALDRDHTTVHADVAELLTLGLIERDGDALRCEIEPGRVQLEAG